MTLLRVKSERLDANGKPYEDYFLCWRVNGSLVYVRVRPCFFKDMHFFRHGAVDMLPGEDFEKYAD